MVSSVELPVKPVSQRAQHHRYDAVTIAFHWVTAALVLFLFASAMLWTYGPRDLRSLESLHVSFGIALAAVLVGRVVWRLVAGRRLAHPGGVVVTWASRVVHWALYALLAIQVGLGFGLKWFEGQALNFFGLWSLPSPFAANRALSHQLEELHNLTAWTLVYLVGAHAIAALVHRYVFKDGVLRRMLPIAG